MGREGERGIMGRLAAHEADVGKRGVVIIRVGSSPLLVLRSKGTGDCRSVLRSWKSSLGFRRVVDKVTVGPFRAAGETSEETRPGENREKRETSEKEDGYVEDEVLVVQAGGLKKGGGVSRAGGVEIAQGIPGGHVGLARPGLEQQENPTRSAKEKKKEREPGNGCQTNP